MPFKHVIIAMSFVSIFSSSLVRQTFRIFEEKLITSCPLSAKWRGFRGKTPSQYLLHTCLFSQFCKFIFYYLVVHLRVNTARKLKLSSAFTCIFLRSFVSLCCHLLYQHANCNCRGRIGHVSSASIHSQKNKSDFSAWVCYQPATQQQQRLGARQSRTKLRGSAAGGGGELGRTYKAEEPHMCGATPAHTLQNDTPPSAISSAAGNLEKLKEPRDTPDHNFRKLLWRIIIFVFLFLFSQFLEES